jgi:hypothetical protein
VVFASKHAPEAEDKVTKRTREVAAQLSERARKEIRLLPFPTYVFSFRAVYRLCRSVFGGGALLFLCMNAYEAVTLIADWSMHL